MDFPMKEELFNHIADKLSDFLIITDLEGNIKNINKPFLNLLKSKKEELTGKSIKILFGDPHSVFETMSFHRPTMVSINYCDEQIPLRLSSSIIFEDDIPVGWLIIARDMRETSKLSSDIKELKKTIKKKEEETTTKLTFLSDALASVGESVFVTDGNQRIIYCNKTGMEKFDYSWGELIGKPTKILYSSPDEGMFKGSWKGEVLVLTKNGKKFPALLTTSPIKNKNGREIGIVGVFRDISELKILLEKLEKAGIELEKRVILRTEELENSKAQLLQSSKMAALGTMAAGIAHELNNPLTIIMGYCHIALNDDGCSEDIKLRIQKIQEQCERAKKIIYNLSIFSRNYKTEKTYVNLLGLIEKTLELRSYDLSVKNISILRKFEPDLPDIYADEHQIQQVFFNLINNAADAILSIRDSGRITIKVMKEDSTLRIILSDNGAGIEEKNIKKIFDPFYTTKEVGKGTGLGLSISYGIIKAHNGNISVNSQRDIGTDLIIDLPLHCEEHPVAAEMK